MVAQGLVKDTNSKKLAEYMVGHEIRTESLKRDQNYGDEMLRLENLSDGKHFRDISLSVRESPACWVTAEASCSRRFLAPWAAITPARW